jgi:hypothetical protein
VTILALNELSRAERIRLGLPENVDHLNRELAERLSLAGAPRAVASGPRASGPDQRWFAGRPLTGVG